MDCPQCLDRLEDVERWRRALKAAAAEGPRVIAWPSKAIALMLAACLVLAVAPLLLWRELSRVRADLDRAQSASSDWQRRYEQSLQAHSEPPLPSTVPVFPLILTRDTTVEPSAPPVHIVLPQAAPWAVLSLELAHDPSLLSYRATLSTVRNRQVWTASLKTVSAHWSCLSHSIPTPPIGRLCPDARGPDEPRQFHRSGPVSIPSRKIVRR